MGEFNEYYYTLKREEVQYKGIIRYGFQDPNTQQWFIQPMFDDLTPFDDWGNCAAKLNEKWGIINEKGEWRIKPIYDEIKGAAGYIYDGDLEAKLNSKWGLINQKGEWIIKPIFDLLEGFSIKDDSYRVKIDGKYGIISVQGNWLIYPKFDDLFSFFDSEGYCGAKLNDKWGFINHQGNWLINPKFEAFENRK